MTANGAHTRAAAETAALLQTQLIALSGQARAALKPGLDALQEVCNGILAEGFAESSPPPGPLKKREQNDEAISLEEVARLVGSITTTLNELTASSPSLRMLDNGLARGRIKQAARMLHTITRTEAMIKATPVLSDILEGKTELKNAFAGLELCGTQAADVLEASPLVRAHLSAAR